VTSGLAHPPQVINDRQRLGDLEGDLVLGKPGCGGLLTAVDRRSRYTRMEKVHNKTAKHVYQRVKKVFHSLPQSQRLSITFNNGTEFAHCPLLEKHHGISLYLAEPGCPYQRGTNENTNGLIRQSFPKGTDFRTVTHAEVKRVENLLNNRPRAYLDYQPPAEVFFANPTNPNCDSH
jgi:IS30 family transposase